MVENNSNQIVSKAEIVLENSAIYIKIEKGVFKVNLNCLLTESKIRCPEQYYKYLFCGDDRAWNLIRGVLQAHIIDFFKTEVLKAALKDGFDVAYSKLEHYIQNSPNGKPKVYLPPETQRSPLYESIDVTDGETCVRLSLTDANHEKLNFPENFYAEHQMFFDISSRQLKTILEDVETFFTFVKRLVKCRRTPDKKIRKCFKLYFTRRRAAMKMLEYFERNETKMNRVDEIYAMLEKSDVVIVPEGYIVNDPDYSFFFARNDGRVFKIRELDTFRLKLDLVKLYDGKHLSGELLREVTERSLLNRVARVIAKVQPDLAVVI